MLTTLAVATDRLLATLRRLDTTKMAAASLLPGWSRATVVAHLTYGAVATARMLREAPSGTVAFYPGGTRQRERSLMEGERLASDALLRRLADGCRELQAVAADVPLPAWDQQVTEPRLGPMALSRLLVLRLTEVEVHHADLGCGCTPRDWLTGFVDIALPLRVAWLAAHHRARPEADRRVQGRWRLVRSDTDQAWVVGTEGVTEPVGVGESPAARGSADVELRGEGWELLALLLGRGDMAQTPEGARFKRAFPGP